MKIIVGEREIIVPACFEPKKVDEEVKVLCVKVNRCSFGKKGECIWGIENGRGPTLTDTTPGLPKVR